MSMPMLPCGRTARRPGRATGLTDDGRADLRHFDRDARLGAAESTGSYLARWLPGLAIAATLAANVAHGLGDGLAGATLAAWPAVALAGSYELSCWQH
jgi:hypothetical protein